MLRHKPYLLLGGFLLSISLLVLLLQAGTGSLLAESGRNTLFNLERRYEGATSQDSLTPTAIENHTQNCRYGLAALSGAQVALLDDLGSGLYVDFGWQSWGATDGIQYLPLVRVTEDKNGGTYLGTYSTVPSIEITNPADPSGLRFWLEHFPGYTWMIGNEVDRGPDPGQTQSYQGDTHPDVYAEAFHDVVEYMRTYDPSARAAVAGLVQVTPGRLQYLDLFWDAHIEKFGYPPEVDVWNMHIYILPEADPSGQPNGIANIALGTDWSLAKRESGGNPATCPDWMVYCYAEHDSMSIFVQQVINMRQWMKEHGQRNKPLVLSEFSVLYPYELDGGSCFIQDEYGNCFTPQRVQNFMTNTFDFLENAVDPNLGYPLDGNRLVQQWVWFSINNRDFAGSVSNLYAHDENGITQIRPLGQQFVNRVSGIPKSVNLVTDAVSLVAAKSDLSGTADAPIWVTLRNNGNTHLESAFNVTFYRNSALTDPIGTASVIPDPLVFGCSQIDYKATVTWNDLAPGVHRFWAKIDSQGVISESNENDNVIEGRVLVDAESTLLPVLFRR